MSKLRKAVLQNALTAYKNDIPQNRWVPDQNTDPSPGPRPGPSPSNTIPTPKNGNTDLSLLKSVKGHDGWIWDVAVDADNEWFATASADTTIKVWSLADATLKLTLTGHLLPVRCLAISAQMPYMFSGGEDQKLLCWDLEHNKPTRSYHGHRSGIYSVALHPEIPYLLASGSRDSSVRLWDVRTRVPIRVLNHDGAVNKLVFQSDEPQLISASQDYTVKLWDIASGRCSHTVTQHSNSVRALACHPIEYTFVSGAHDSIKQWKLPDCEPLGDFNTVKGDQVWSMVCDTDDNVFTCHDSALKIYNYTNGEILNTITTDSPAICCAIDHSNTRLITGHMDKRVAVWRIT